MLFFPNHVDAGIHVGSINRYRLHFPFRFIRIIVFSSLIGCNRLIFHRYHCLGVVIGQALDPRVYRVNRHPNIVQSLQACDDLVGGCILVVISSQNPRNHGKGVLVLQREPRRDGSELAAALVAFYRRHGHDGGHLLERRAEVGDVSLVARADLRVRRIALHAPSIEVGGYRESDKPGLDIGGKVHNSNDAYPVFIRFPTRYVMPNRSVDLE